MNTTRLIIQKVMRPSILQMHQVKSRPKILDCQFINSMLFDKFSFFHPIVGEKLGEVVSNVVRQDCDNPLASVEGLCDL